MCFERSELHFRTLSIYEARCAIAIEFQPQGPGNVEKIGLSYGVALARQADREFGLKSSGQAADIGLRSSALAQQDEHFQSQLADHRGQAIMQEQGQMARQEAGFSHQEQMAKLETELNATKLGQAENIRRQRLQTQVDYIRANTGEGKKFSAEDGANMEMQVMTDLNPLQQQYQRQQILQSQAQTQHIQHTVAQQATMQQQNEAFQARALPDATVRHRDDNGNLIAITHPDGRGGYHTMQVKPEAPTMTPQIMARFATTARSEQTREEQFAARAGQPPPAWAATPQAREVDRQRRVNEMVADHSGGGGATRGDAATDRSGFAAEMGAIINQALAPRGAAGQPAPAQNAPQAAPSAPANYDSPMASGMS